MPTPNLALTPLEAAQSQKHVTVNEALARLDAAVQLSVIDRAQSAPPPTPTDGDRYLIAAPATGAWQSREGDVAAWDETALGWQFFTPRPGWRVWIDAEALMLVYTGSEWASFASSQLGINTSADATNRLAVASDALLFTHDGADVQTKINKATESDTASLVFQTGYTGHAEIGLTGDNDLHIKTSPDGSGFTDAMIVEHATGIASFPSGARSAGLTLNADMTPNMLPDSGRFGGDTENAALRVTTFVPPGYLTSYNGSTITPHARFIHNNTTYGGTSGALDPEVDALVSLLRIPSRRRYGAEWWATRIELGSGTLASDNADGTVRYPAVFGITAPMPRAFTVGYYIRVLSGSAAVNQEATSRFARWGVDETGNLAASVVEPSDGWVFIERQMTFNDYGYNQATFRLSLESQGDALLIAMPRIVFGHTELDPYLPGPLPNTRFYG